MRNNLRRFIVENLKTLYYNEERDLEIKELEVICKVFLATPVFCITACLLYWFDCSFVPFFLRFLFGICFLGFLAIFAVSTMDNSQSQAEIKQITFKNLLGYALHLITPGKIRRQDDLETFLWQQAQRRREMQRIRNEHEERLARIPSFTSDPKFKDITKENLSSWVKEHVGKEKSLISFFNDRVLGTKHLRLGLTYWSQIIPRKENFDDFKFLLKLNPIVNSEQLNTLKAINKEEVNFAFKDYSSEDIKRLFSSSFELKDYLEVISHSRDNNLPLKVEVDMKDLLAWAQAMNAGIRGLKFVFPRDKEWVASMEEQECWLGKVEFIKNLAELSYWASAMNNCIKSYESKIFNRHSYFFGISLAGNPKVVFELNSKGQLIQAKKKANAPLSQDEERVLSNFLSQHI